MVILSGVVKVLVSKLCRLLWGIYNEINGLGGFIVGVVRGYNKFIVLICEVVLRVSFNVMVLFIEWLMRLVFLMFNLFIYCKIIVVCILKLVEIEGWCVENLLSGLLMM